MAAAASRRTRAQPAVEIIRPVTLPASLPSLRELFQVISA
jgi:hypothetical protein